MSQKSVEATIGRLVCDDWFRNQFLRNPLRALRGAGIVLTGEETQSLKSLKLSNLRGLAGDLDPRIRTADRPEED